MRLLFCFFKKENRVPQYKKMTQLTPSDSKTEKDSSQKSKHRVTEKKIQFLQRFDGCSELYICVSTTEKTLKLTS